MSYTPTTWTTGDTITATAMNKIENGIASAGGTALVKIVGDGDCGSVYIGLGRIRSGQHPTLQDFWSLENCADDFGGCYNIAGYGKVAIEAIPLDPSGDYQTCLTINDYIYSNFDIITSGNIESTPVTACERYSATTWSSSSVYCYIITGDCTVTVSPK